MLEERRALEPLLKCPGAARRIVLCRRAQHDLEGVHALRAAPDRCHVHEVRFCFCLLYGCGVRLSCELRVRRRHRARAGVECRGLPDGDRGLQQRFRREVKPCEPEISTGSASRFSCFSAIRSWDYSARIAAARGSSRRVARPAAGAGRRRDGVPGLLGRRHAHLGPPSHQPHARWSGHITLRTGSYADVAAAGRAIAR